MEATFYHESAPRVVFLILRVRLPTSYLSDEVDATTPPEFEVESAPVSQGRLSRFCEELDRLYNEQPDSPVLFSWIEFLRTEAWELMEESKFCDPRALKLWVEAELTEQAEAMQPEVPTCINCHNVVVCSKLETCGHTVCSACISSTMQVEDANECKNRCPLPTCRKPLTATEESSLSTCHEAWTCITPKILKTSFQDMVVFCPRCEDRGIDSPVLIGQEYVATSELSNVTRQCNCTCFKCGWRFCGFCRSPCHPGSGCFDEESRVVRLAKRRPPLSSELQDMAVRIAEEVKKNQRLRAKEIADAMKSTNFDAISRIFLDAHEDRIRKSLEQVFAAPLKLYAAPISVEVIGRFMKSYMQHPSIELRPAFHGTDARNHNSIFERGLLIPGDQNELSIVHGAAHGRGVYTANIDAAWLSRGFCSHPTMLVCGVLQTPSVRHVFDAMVVGDSSHVVPLYVCEAASFAGMSTAPSKVIAPVTRSPVSVGPSQPATTAKAKSNAKVPPQSKGQTPMNKQSKFKARLSKLSNRH